MRLIYISIFVMALSGCRVPGPQFPGPTPTPVPTEIPTATPTPYATSQGSALVEFTGLDKIPLAPTLDNIGLGVLTAETDGYDRSKPVMELAVRGTTSQPCLSRPCGDLMGLVVRFDANLAYDDTLDWTPGHADKSQRKACGQGENYAQRLALGPAPVVRVLVEWADETVTISTPADKAVFSLIEGQRKAPGSMGFARWVPGLPWPRKAPYYRSWLWDTFSATQYGVQSRVVSWGASTGLDLRECP